MTKAFSNCIEEIRAGYRLSGTIGANSISSFDQRQRSRAAGNPYVHTAGKTPTLYLLDLS